MSYVRDILDGRTGLVEEIIVEILSKIKKIYKREPNVVEIPKTRLFFIGDLHGDIDSIREISKHIEHSDHHAVFMGDYVDRGPAQVDTLVHVLCLKIQYPDRVTLLRGNHESRDVCSRYGFETEVKRNYSRNLFEEFLETFSVLPVAAMSKSGIFACHGGVPQGVRSINDINRINRFYTDFNNEVLAQLVWNDPKEMDVEFTYSIRGGDARYFGWKSFTRFVDNLGINLFFRAHEVFPEGIRRFFDGKLISVFSTSYRGRVTPKIARVDSKLAVHEIRI